MPVLVVQKGHCYRTTGATGTTGEQGYATRVADACATLLHGRGGWQVRAILADAPASQYAGDAFFAIHCDGSTAPTARGASIGYRTPEGQEAGQAWKRAYGARGWPGFRPDNYTAALQGYYGTGTAVGRGNRRAVILETGFRTNAEDRALLDGPGGPERVALSIGDALGIPLPPPPEVSDMELTDEVVWWNGKKVMVKDIFAAMYIASSGLLGNAAFPGEGVVQLPPLVGIRAGVDGLGDDETKFLAAIQGVHGELLTGLASVLAGLETVDGTPSDEQVAQLGNQLNAILPPAIANQLGQRLITPPTGN